MRGRTAHGWITRSRHSLPAGRASLLSLAVIGSVLISSLPGLATPGRAVKAPDFSSAPGPDLHVLQLALEAAAEARGTVAVENPSLLTVIDYSRPSTEQRLWVLDLDRRQVLFAELVAHGRGSGENHATRFSNRPGSHQSSLGLFLTLDTYVGRNGYSLRMQGLEPGINDQALERAIVMHGAPYVSSETAGALGRLGRSWGCPALSLDVARDLIDTIKQGSLVFAYYPDAAWLLESPFLGAGGRPRAAATTTSSTRNPQPGSLAR